MSTPRLNTKVWVGALIRRVHAAGDFAAVIKKGDETAGAVLLVVRRRDGSSAVMSRAIQSHGHYAWVINLDEPPGAQEAINNFLEKQRRYDPDLWIVELDTDNPERFIDETIGSA